MQTLSLLRHLLTAQTRFRVHSPFVFSLINEVLCDQRHYYAFDDIEDQRQRLLRDQRVITRLDFGAGQSGREETVSQIARNAGAPAKQGKMLFRLVQFLGSRHILELGTSLGLGTQYLAGSGRHERIITLEGDPKVAGIASEHLQNIARLEQRIGPFKEQLLLAIDDLDQLDLVYFDGDHTEKGTLAYFEACLEKAGPGTCFVLDDIHWSEGMEKAWAIIIQHPSVRLSLDLYRSGLVFFRTEQREKEHFVLFPI